MNASRGSSVGSGPTIYCCGRMTNAILNSSEWRCYWCSKRIRVVWPL